MTLELIKCIQCGEKYESTDELIYWDDQGFGYSTCLSKCPFCSQLNIVKYKNDSGFDVNKDERWY